MIFASLGECLTYLTKALLLNVVTLKWKEWNVSERQEPATLRFSASLNGDFSATCYRSPLSPDCVTHSFILRSSLIFTSGIRD